MNIKTLTLGSRSWEIPQLPFAVTIEIEDITKAFAGNTTHALKVCLAGIKRVDASVTLESLTEDFIPLEQVIVGADLVTKQCGMERAKEGEA